MSANDVFWNWAIKASAIGVTVAGFFAVVYLAVTLWRNRRRK